MWVSVRRRPEMCRLPSEQEVYGEEYALSRQKLQMVVPVAWAFFGDLIVAAFV